MLQYNCEKKLNFSVIDDFICAGDNNVTEKYSSDEEVLTTYDDVMVEAQNISNLLESAEEVYPETTDLNNKHSDMLNEYEEKSLPNKVVVSTYNMNDNINQTIDDFFAASHSTGIQIQVMSYEQ